MCLVKGLVKAVVFAFNLIFLLVGGAFIILGSFYLADFNDVTSAIPDPYSHIRLIPILTIVVGSIIFLISFLGCCGTIRSSPCLLTTYAVILLLIFILQVALGVFAFMTIKNDGDLKDQVKTRIDELFHKSDNASVELVDIIQDQLKCCGVNGPSFWISDHVQDTIPRSCYKEENITYQEGCKDAFFRFLHDTSRILAIVVLVLSATEVIGATLALCLANSVRNDLRRNEYY